MDEECTVLTSHPSARQRARSVPSREPLIDLYARRRTATSILLRDSGGSSRKRPRIGRSLPLQAEPALTAIAVDTRPNIEAVLGDTLRLAGPRLVAMEGARLLTGEIDPFSLREEPGDATRLTLYCRRRDRAFQMPAFEAACELLYRRGIAGATVLSGIDGSDAVHGLPQQAQVLRHDADVPLMVIAVGAGDRIAMLLPELGGMFRRPLMTIERVRLCKRDGRFISRPRPASGAADAGARAGAGAGMTAQFKLTAYTSEAARYEGQPVHRAIVQSLSSAGISGATTVLGIWGYHGDHAPHGYRFPRAARHVPVVTTVIAGPDRISAAFDAIDPLTDGRGLVTAETVWATQPTADATSLPLPDVGPEADVRARFTASRQRSILGTTTAVGLADNRGHRQRSLR